MPVMYFIYDDFYLQHQNGMGHPENPDRLVHIKEAADGLEQKKMIEYISPLPADAGQLEMVHDAGYIRRVAELSVSGGLSFLDMDTGVNRHTYDCALLAAGGCFRGIDLILGGGTGHKKFFLACRPPGHHAFPARGSGFCIFNNAALGARYAANEYEVARTAIIDFDAHHGNGTQDIFYEDGSVFYISFHQYPHYPGSGRVEENGHGKGKGYTLNFPFIPGTGEDDYLAALIDIVLPALDRFRPELIMVSAGYDSHRSDNMSSLALVEDSYRKMMNLLSLSAGKNCRGRMAVVLEGGYDYRSTSDSVIATVAGSLEDIDYDDIDNSRDMEELLGMDRSFRKTGVRNNDVLDRAARISDMDR